MTHSEKNTTSNSLNLIPKSNMLTIQDLFFAEVHLGHPSKDWNARMEPYIYSIQEDRHLIDLERTLPSLRRAMNFLKKVSRHGGKILFVGTQNSEVAQITQIAAKITNQSYISTRWVHGSFSNWNSISQSISELNEFEKRLDHIRESWPIRKGKLYKPSTSEILSSSFSPSVRRRYKRLKYLFEGVRTLSVLPSAIVLLDDLTHHRAIIEEAQRKLIAVIGIIDSNSNPYGIQYPIPGNDDSLKSIHLYAKFLTHACIEGDLLRQQI